ncbi:MAG: PHP domain-containing protein [Merdibacter sp.]
MFGAVDFCKCAKKHGVKPIIGCEVMSRRALVLISSIRSIRRRIT